MVAPDNQSQIQSEAVDQDSLYEVVPSPTSIRIRNKGFNMSECAAYRPTAPMANVMESGTYVTVN